MSLRVTCPECNAVFSVDDEMRGKRVRCRECQYAFAAPGRKGDDGIYDAKGKSDPVPTSRRGNRDDDDDGGDAPAPAKKGKGGLVAVLLVAGSSLVLLFVLCSGLVVTLFLVSRPEPQAELPVAKVGQPPFLFPGDLPPDMQPKFPNPEQNPGGPIILDPDPAPVVEPGPNVNPNPNPKVDPAPERIAGETRDKVKASTVYLRVRMPGGAECEGSGFFAVEPGIVVTNAHVLGMMQATSRPPTNVDVVIKAGQPGEQTVKATVLGVDRFTDLAVLRVAGDNLPPPLPVESAGTLAELQNVYYFGFPLGKQLGTEISIGAGRVSSIRKDATGAIAQVQFDGNMQPGNSGGPVIDSAGRVVGVAVAIIPGKNINFAVAGDMIKPIIDGRVDETPRFGERYRAGNEVNLPVRFHLINPLGRVASVRVEVWTGSAGPARPAVTPAPGAMPPPQPGDSPIKAVTFAVVNGVAKGDIALPSVPAGQVLWMRPVLVGATERYLVAKQLPDYPYPPLDRVAANLQMKMDQAAERTLKIADRMQITLQQGKLKLSEGLRFEADVLEVLTPGPKGTGTRLTVGTNRFNDEINGRPVMRAPAMSNRLRTLSPNFLVDATGKLRERGNPALPNNLAKPLRDELEMMYNRLCNAFELTSVYLPNRTLNARDTWPAKIPTVAGAGANKKIVDLAVICTYEGSRANAGRNEAVISLLGDVHSRDASRTESLGKVRGRIVFDVEAGMIAQVEVHVSTEIDTKTQARVLVTEDVSVVRTLGNSTNIVVVAKKEPAPNPNPKTEPKTEPKTSPKTEPKTEPSPTPVVVVKNVLNVDGLISKNDFLGPNGRKHKHYDVKLQAGITYVIEMKQVPGTSLNPFLILQDAAGKELAKDDDGGGNKDAKIVFTAPQAGVYRVIATTRFGGGTQMGRYHVSVTAKE